MIKSTPDRNAFNMMAVGYRDYLAARYLLNNDLLMQGIGLSSLAVEKYLKSILVSQNIILKVHLDQWTLIKASFIKNKITLFNELDENYLNLLGRAFSLRYYDRISNTSRYAFKKWQVLAELDFVVNLIESRTNFHDGSGSVIKTNYGVDVESIDPNLYLENYVLQGREKKEYMERESFSVIVCFDKSGYEIVGHGLLPSQEYKGKILVDSSINVF
jgi:hypothetical protein